MVKIDSNTENLDDMKAAMQERENANAWSEVEFYDKEVAPLFKELVEKCALRNIPLVVHIIAADDGEKKVISSCLNTGGRENTEKMVVLANILMGRISIEDLLPVFLLVAAVSSHKEG